MSADEARIPRRQKSGRIDDAITRIARQVIATGDSRRIGHVFESDVRPGRSAGIAVYDDIVLEMERSIGRIGIADPHGPDQGIPMNEDLGSLAILIDIQGPVGIRRIDVVKANLTRRYSPEPLVFMFPNSTSLRTF